MLLNITVPQDVNELVIGLPVARNDVIRSPGSIPDATQPSTSLETGQADSSSVSDTGNVQRLSTADIRDSVASLAKTISASFRSLTDKDVETSLLEQREVVHANSFNIDSWLAIPIPINTVEWFPKGGSISEYRH